MAFASAAQSTSSARFIGGGAGGSGGVGVGNSRNHNSSTTANFNGSMALGAAGDTGENSSPLWNNNPIFPLEKEQKKEIEDLREQLRKTSKVREFPGHTCKVHSVDWNCDGRKLASGSFDKTVCVFLLEPTKLRLEQTCKGHTDSVDQLCWHQTHPDLLATASGDKTVRIWDTRQQKSTASYPTKGENINITWSPDGNYIAAGNKDDLVTIIDLRTSSNIIEEQFKFEVNEITWDPTSKFFFLTNGEGSVIIYKWPEFEVKHKLNAHTANCICIEFHPSGDYFAVGSADAIVSLWTSDTLACIRTFSRLDWPVRAISFNYNGSLLASASEDLIIDIAHTDTAEKIAQVPVETPTFTVAFHPSKNIMAYACDDKDKYNQDRDLGIIKVFGLPNE